MRALQIQTVVDEAVASALPPLREFLGKTIDLRISEPEEEVEIPAKVSFEEFLAHRVSLPGHLSPLSDDEIDNAISRGACGVDS
jgi:hypothetical protein